MLPALRRKERRIPYISEFVLQSIHLGLRLLRLALAPSTWTGYLERNAFIS